MEILGFMSLTPDETFTKVPDGQASNTKQIISHGPTGAVRAHALGAMLPSTAFTAARRAAHIGRASTRPSTAHGGWSASGK